jgi:hypothetical protein
MTEEHARKHRKTCIFIAEQAYQLVNAIDAGVKGGALDTDDVLQEHIARLNVLVFFLSPYALEAD